MSHYLINALALHGYLIIMFPLAEYIYSVNSKYALIRKKEHLTTLEGSERNTKNLIVQRQGRME